MEQQLAAERANLEQERRAQSVEQNELRRSAEAQRLLETQRKELLDRKEDVRHVIVLLKVLRLTCMTFSVPPSTEISMLMAERQAAIEAVRQEAAAAIRAKEEALRAKSDEDMVRTGFVSLTHCNLDCYATDAALHSEGAAERARKGAGRVRCAAEAYGNVQDACVFLLTCSEHSRILAN